MITIYSNKKGPQVFILKAGELGTITGSVVLHPGYSRLEEDTFNQLCKMYPTYFSESDQGVEARFRINAEKVRRSVSDHFIKEGQWVYERQITEKDARELWNTDLGIDLGLLCNVVYFANSDGQGGQTLLHALTLVNRARGGNYLYFGLAGKVIGELKSTAEEHKINWLVRPQEWLGLCKGNAPVTRAS